jgi:hypothetical protein
MNLDDLIEPEFEKTLRGPCACGKRACSLPQERLPGEEKNIHREECLTEVNVMRAYQCGTCGEHHNVSVRMSLTKRMMRLFNLLGKD